MRPLEGQVALVTGASRGIGAAAAIELARRGAQVVLTARTQGGLEETDDAIRAAGGSATLLPLDLIEQQAELDQLGPSLLQRFRRLDILVSNAGMLGTLTPAPHILPKDWTALLAVNLSAHWRLIRSCGPLLAIAPAGRAVFVTAGRARAPRAYWGGYGATLAAMEHLVLTWAEETRETTLRVNLFDPGPIATRLRRQAYPGEEQAELRQPADVAPALVDLCMPELARHGESVVFQASNPE